MVDQVQNFMNRKQYLQEILITNWSITKPWYDSRSYGTQGRFKALFNGRDIMAAPHIAIQWIWELTDENIAR